MLRIESVKGREVLDSRGEPTVEVDVTLAGGARGRFTVPSGASTGENEAVALRDGDGKRFGGRGVLKAVENVNGVIAKAVVGLDGTDQINLDRRLCDLDGTDTKSRLGANAILGVSMATAQAAAAGLGVPLFRYVGGVVARTLPVPQFNVLNGGRHADSGLDVQEFMLMPVGAESFAEALRVGAEVFGALKKLLTEKGFSTAVGDEGGFAPRLTGHEHALSLLVDAGGRAGYEAGEDVVLALDAAASEFYDANEKVYRLKTEGRSYEGEALVDYWAALAEKFPIASLEDGMAEDDWAGWRLLTERLGAKVQLVGDDIFCTNVTRLARGIEGNVANALLVKVNQIGTLSETLDAVAMAKAGGYACVFSHRSGDTEDTAIADLVVATNAGQIKSGSLCRSERMAKWNQLLRIEEALGPSAQFAGEDVLRKTAWLDTTGRGA
ncbi:MAG: phosphopyruvate hydratase [Deltaproteobacteria bacterium]|nr:phosphopyruvate hydratase [Deltaproteobacteria bacterium]